MAEDIDRQYEDIDRQYKEDQSAVGETSRRLATVSGSVRFVRRYPVRSRSSEPTVDYATFKATIASAVDELKLEMHDQHQQTRAEVQTVRRDVLAAIKESPAEYVKVACEFGALFLLFSLAVRFILKIELVNTAFALFMLPSLAVYWAMARLKQESDKRDHENPQS